MSRITRDPILLNAVAMTADQTSRAYEVTPGTKIAARVKTTQGVAAPDHVGVVKFKGGISNVVTDAQDLAIPQVTISSGAEVNTLVEFDCYFPYLWAWYDYTSGGTDDTLKVTIAKRK